MIASFVLFVLSFALKFIVEAYCDKWVVLAAIVPYVNYPIYFFAGLIIVLAVIRCIKESKK